MNDKMKLTRKIEKQKLVNAGRKINRKLAWRNNARKGLFSTRKELKSGIWKKIKWKS